MDKKTRILIIVGMVALLVATGFVNFYLLRSKSTTTSSASNADYFELFRSNREATEQTLIDQYDEIINGSSYSADAKKQAEEDRLNLIKQIKEESDLESLIKANCKFPDAAVQETSKAISVVVKADSLDDQQVANIKDVVMKNTNWDVSSLTVLNVSN